MVFPRPTASASNTALASPCSSADAGAHCHGTRARSGPNRWPAPPAMVSRIAIASTALSCATPHERHLIVAPDRRDAVERHDERERTHRAGGIAHGRECDDLARGITSRPLGRTRRRHAHARAIPGAAGFRRSPRRAARDRAGFAAAISAPSMRFSRPAAGEGPIGGGWSSSSGVCATRLPGSRVAGRRAGGADHLAPVNAQLERNKNLTGQTII